MEMIYVRRNDKHLKVSFDEILFLEASGSYLKLVTSKGEFSISQNLSQFMRKNPIPTLVRVHRSYVVNLKYVESFDSRFIYVGLIKIPIGNTHRNKLMSQIHCV